MKFRMIYIQYKGSNFGILKINEDTIPLIKVKKLKINFYIIEKKRT